MEAPQREHVFHGTPAHQERIKQRLTDLRQQVSAILSPSAEFVWELGCGHGHFLTAFAAAHPNQLCVGIDIMADRIERALRKRDRARLQNLFFVHADARLFLHALPASTRFSDLYILFPDPWPKSRHHKHRILQTDFLSLAATKAKSEAWLHFRTDHQPYFAEAQALLSNHSMWKIGERVWPYEYCTVFQNRAPEYHSLSARRL